MGVEEGARKMAVRREPREGQSTAKPTEVVGAANISAVQKVLKDALISALPMVVAVVAATKTAPELQGGNPVVASGMEAARGARWRIAPRAQKVTLASASPMEAAGAANFLHVERAHRGALCSVRRTVGVKGAQSWGVRRVLKGAQRSARAMVAGNAVHSRMVVCARRVCMVAPNSVLRMAVARGVL